MNFLKKVVSVIRAYDYRDKVISVAAVAIFLLMLVKMIIFPYGMLGLGETKVYTEGIVSKNGIQNINPLFVDYNEADREVSRLVFAGLMKYDPESKAVVDDMGMLSISEDKTEYVFKMRDGLKWHDGKPVTAEDVYFTFHDIVLDPSFPNEILKMNFSGVNVELVDEKTVKFQIGKPNIFFIANFVIGILPKHILGGVDPGDLLQNEFNKKPVGAGPYMVNENLETFPNGRTQITLERSPYYYGDVSDIEFMRFIAYPSMEDLIDEVDSVNGVVKVSGKYISDFQNNDRFELIPYELPQYTAVFMNMESKVLDDKNVRLALMKAVDKDTLLADSTDKIRVDTPLMELNQEDWYYKYSLEEANGALKDAGYEYNEEDKEKSGIRYNDDEDALELNFIARLYDEGTYQFEETKKVVEFLNSVWESIGFSIQVEFLPEEEFKSRVSSRKYDLLFVGQALGYNLDTYSYWHSTQATPMGQNLSNYKSFQVDSLIEDIRYVFNLDKRKSNLKDLAKNIKEDVPAIFLYRPVYYYAPDGQVSGVSMEDVVFSSDRFSNISKWKFE
ncbi:MAG: ABC transporter substrate-binding protein [Patescibacteria group bacterium]